MKRHGWYAAEGREKILFETPAAARWTAAWRAEGIDPAMLAGETGQA
jgi:putative transcriptional regulator